MKYVLNVLVIIGLFAGSTVWAQDKATPKDVYDLVLKAYEVVQSLSDEALPAFNDPKGEFVYKDTYVFVQQCPKYVVAHPFALDKLKGKDLREKFPFQTTLCEGGKNPNGNWVEYQWPKPGSKELSRKISFVIQVVDTPYTVAAGIYNEEVSIEELQKTVK